MWKPLLVALAVLSICTPAEATLIAVSWSTDGSTSEVVRINQTTGASSVIGVSGVAGLNSLAADSSGRLIAASGVDYYEVDPATGSATEVLSSYATSGVRSNSIRGLAFDSNDTLYVVGDAGSLQRPLLTMDLNTGVGSLIGLTGFTGVQALEFSPDGILYGWDATAGLITIDPGTGVGTAVSSSPPADLIQSIAFAPNGTMYGISQTDLYTIDPTTAQLHHIAPIYPGGWRGLAFVPEAPFGLLMLCAAALMVRRRRLADGFS